MKGAFCSRCKRHTMKVTNCSKVHLSPSLQHMLVARYPLPLFRVSIQSPKIHKRLPTLVSSPLKFSVYFVFFSYSNLSLTTDNPIWVKFVTLVGNLSFKLWAVEGLILKKTQFNIQRKTFCVLSDSDVKIQTQNNIMMNTVCTLKLVY